MVRGRIVIKLWRNNVCTLFLLSDQYYLGPNDICLKPQIYPVTYKAIYVCETPERSLYHVEQGAHVATMEPTSMDEAAKYAEAWVIGKCIRDREVTERFQR